MQQPKIITTARLTACGTATLSKWQTAAAQRVWSSMPTYLSEERKPRRSLLLMSVVAALPADAGLHAKIGQVLLDGGQIQISTGTVSGSLATRTHNGAALIGAGKTAFDSGDDRAAERYLDQGLSVPPSRDQSSKDSRAQHLLAVARASAQLDPYQSGLSPAARASRAATGYQLSMARLSACAASTGISLSSTEKNSSTQRFAKAVRTGAVHKQVCSRICAGARPTPN